MKQNVTAKYFVFLATFGLLLLSATVKAGNIPADAWQTGTLRDSSESWHSRSAGMLNGSQGNLNGMMVSREYPIVHYIVETNQYVYEADLTLRHRRDKQPTLTVNGPVKFAVANSDVIRPRRGRERVQDGFVQENIENPFPTPTSTALKCYQGIVWV
jgi:hypothetical protein